MAEAVFQCAPHERLDLLVRIADPARRGRVRRIARFDDLELALRTARLPGAQHRDRFLRCEDVVDVPEVDGRHELLGREIREQPPERLALELGPEVPNGVDDGARRQMDRALLGSDPSQLRVGDEAPPEAAHVLADAVERPADHERLERADRRNADFGAPAAREGEAVTLEADVRRQHDVGGRVVRVGVHRIRAVEPARGRKPDVAGAEREDSRAIHPISFIVIAGSTATAAVMYAQ